VEGATAILFTVTAGMDLTLAEIQEAAEIIRKAADPSANIIFGMSYAPEMSNEIRITLIATGFNAKPGKASKQAMENEMKELRKFLLDEDQMDIPAFLRNPIRNKRELITRAQQATPQPAQAANAKFKTAPRF
jgi:cell division protein FtsZ